MNFYQKFIKELSTSLKFVALLSVTFQILLISILLFKVCDSDILFPFIVIFYFFIIVIGFSRYVEVKSKNIKEKFLNFFLLLNCFPFIIGVLILLLLSYLALKPEPKPVEIDPQDVRVIVIDKNGNKIEKGSDEINIDFKNKKLKDSIIQVKFEK